MSIKIANTSFESELLQDAPLPLDQLLAQNNVYRALQLTPFFLRRPQDTVLLTEPPSHDFISELENFGHFSIALVSASISAASSHRLVGRICKH